MIFLLHVDIYLAWVSSKHLALFRLRAHPPSPHVFGCVLYVPVYAAPVHSFLLHVVARVRVSCLISAPIHADARNALRYACIYP